MRSKSPNLADIMPAEANNFGAIRLMMALAVLVSHSYWLATGQSSLEPFHAWTGHSLGEHAVQVFFFLSGVVVAGSLLKSRSLLDFAVARLLRIFPALIACVLLTALVLGPVVTGLSLKAYVTQGGWLVYIAKTVTLTTGSAPLPGVFADLPVPRLVNLSLWTLKYEVICYVLLAVFGMAYLHLPRLRTLLTIALSVVVASIFIAPKPVDGYSMAQNIRYFILFFGMGTLAYLLRERLVLSWFAVVPLFLAFALAIDTRFAELTSALFLGYATLLVAKVRLPRLRWFTNQQDYSFGVYIWACPIQQALIQVEPGISPWKLTIIALLIVMPLSVFSWTHIERPAMGLRKVFVAWLRALVPARRASQAAAPVAVTASNAANAAERAPHVPRPAGEPAPRKVHRPDAAPLRRLKQMAQPTPDVLQVMLDGRRQNAIPRHTAKPGLVLDRG